MRTARILFGAFTVVAACLTAPGASAAPTRLAIDCSNSSITKPGTYIVRNSVSGCSALRIITIAASDVVLDLNGNILDGDNNACGTAIEVTGERTGVKVRNGTVRDCGVGVLFGALVTGSKISNVRAVSNLAEGIKVESKNRIVSNVATFNGAPGIAANDANLIQNNVVSGSPDTNVSVDSLNVIVGNTITDATGYGLFSGGDNTISSNIFRSNGNGMALTGKEVVKRNIVDSNNGHGVHQLGGADVQVIANTVKGNLSGIVVKDSNVVRDNIVKGNSSDGIFGESLNTIRDNVSSGNGRAGIWVSEPGNTLIGNRTNGNARDGIFVAQPTATTTIKNNTANDNVEQGIDADADVGVVGSGNSAKGNGIEPQCDPSYLCP